MCLYEAKHSNLECVCVCLRKTKCWGKKMPQNVKMSIQKKCKFVYCTKKCIVVDTNLFIIVIFVMLNKTEYF